MAGTEDRESLGIDNNASARASMQEEDEDEFALAAMGISDGFRPSEVGTDGVRGHSRIPSQVSQHQIPGRRTPPPRPSSTAKPKGLDSFALRNDGGMGLIGAQRNSITTSTVTSGLSSLPTEMGLVGGVERPDHRSSASPHPHHMYSPESRLARTASVATTSTVLVPERPYNGPGGPTHPYGMYPQNIVPEADGSDGMPSEQPILVGFPGSNNHYQRRLGSHGEEAADIIGPDGHTEQLPPYTKYPDEAFARKSRLSLQLPPAGAGGVGLATRNPEYDSQETLNSPQSRHSTRSMTSDSSNHQINMAAVTVSEKPQLRSWQIRAKRKVCGIIPVWALAFIIIIFILFGIILGAVLAILKQKTPIHHHWPAPPPESVVSSTVTTTFDVAPLTASPTELPIIPTGTYALPITVPSTIQNSCILNTAMSAAWSCTVPWSSYTITVSPVPGSQNELANYQINLGLGNNTFGNYYAFGTQPPVLPNTQVLNLVTDTQDPGRGPAWFFELPYDKLVIVPEPLLSGPSSKRDIAKRDYGGWEHSASAFSGRRGVAQPGDRPWFCYWNGTLLEAFVYVNLSSSASKSSSTSSSAAASTITPPPSTATSHGSGASGSASVQSSASSGASQQMYWNPAYPKVVKLEERRIPRGDDSIPPYCIQNSIDASGVASPILNSTGQPITIYLNESQPTTISQISGRDELYVQIENLETIAERDTELVERQMGGSCGCVWLWT